MHTPRKETSPCLFASHTMKLFTALSVKERYLEDLISLVGSIIKCLDMSVHHVLQNRLTWIHVSSVVVYSLLVLCIKLKFGIEIIAYQQDTYVKSALSLPGKIFKRKEHQSDLCLHHQRTTRSPAIGLDHTRNHHLHRSTDWYNQNAETKVITK